MTHSMCQLCPHCHRCMLAGSESHERKDGVVPHCPKWFFVVENRGTRSLLSVTVGLNWDDGGFSSCGLRASTGA